MRNPLKVIRAYINYYRAKNLADACHKHDGERYYVVADGNRNLWVGDKLGLRNRDRQVWLKLSTEQRKARKYHNLSVATMEKMCFYCTPYSDDVKGRLTPRDIKVKKQQFIEYATKRNKK